MTTTNQNWASELTNSANAIDSIIDHLEQLNHVHESLLPALVRDDLHQQVASYLGTFRDASDQLTAWSLIFNQSEAEKMTITFYKTNSIKDPGVEVSAAEAGDAFWEANDWASFDWAPFNRTAPLFLMDTYGGWDVEGIDSFVSAMWARRPQEEKS